MQEPVEPDGNTETDAGASAAGDGDGLGGRRAPGQRGDDDPLYVISVAAKLVGMPAWTLRVLDEQGIVTPKRTDKNRRLYSDRDLARLARVRTLTEVEGVNMNGVRLILRLEEDRPGPPKGD